MFTIARSAMQRSGDFRAAISRKLVALHGEVKGSASILLARAGFQRGRNQTHSVRMQRARMPAATRWKRALPFFFSESQSFKADTFSVIDFADALGVENEYPFQVSDIWIKIQRSGASCPPPT